MGIRLEQNTEQQISFGEINALKSLGTRTFSVWFKGAFRLNVNVFGGSGTYTPGGYIVSGYHTGFLSFISHWTSSINNIAYWFKSGLSIPQDAWTHVCVSYNSGSTTNDPLVYVNGELQNITKLQAPSGTLIDSSANDCKTQIGPLYVEDPPISYTVAGVRIYNRILSAAEIALLYAGRGRDNLRNGLVFHPFLKGAAGLQACDGATLAAGNVLKDALTGASGVPTNSPVGVGDDHLIGV